MYHLFFLTLNWPVGWFVLLLILALGIMAARASQPSDRKVYDRPGRYPSLARLAVAGVLYFGCFWHMWTWVSVFLFPVAFWVGLIATVAYKLTYRRFAFPELAVAAKWLSRLALAISLTLLVVTACGALGVSHWRWSALFLLLMLAFALVALAWWSFGQIVLAGAFGLMAIFCLAVFLIAGAHLHHNNTPQAGGSTHNSTSAVPTPGSSTPSATPPSSASTSATPSAIPTTPASSASSTAASQGGGGGSVTSVALESPGPGNCAPGPAILAELRKQKPGGEDFRAPYDSYELQTLASTEESWVATHVNEPCVRAIAARYDVSPKALPAYMQTHFSLREVGHGGLTVQNSYFDHQNGSIVWWQVQHFPQGELVWFSPSGVPLQKYVCLNALKRVTPQSGKTSTSPSPSSTPTTPSAPSTHPSTTHKPKPTPTPTPTCKSGQTGTYPNCHYPPKTPPSLNDYTRLNDVDAGQTSPNFCASVYLPHGDSGYVFFSTNYGSFSQSSFKVSGSAKVCATYTAPYDKGTSRDTVTVKVVDNVTGLSASGSESFPINQPSGSRP